MAANFAEYTTIARQSIQRTSQGLPPQTVEDLAQTALEKSLRNIAYGPADNPRGWLNVVARHATLDHVRRAGRVSIELFDPQTEDRPDRAQTVASAENEGLSNGNELLVFVAGVLRERFTDKRKKAGKRDTGASVDIAEESYRLLILKAQGMSDKQCAQELDLDIGTVRTRLHRIRKTFNDSRELLEAYVAGEDVSLSVENKKTGQTGGQKST